METDRNHNAFAGNGDSPNGSTEFHTQFIDSLAQRGALRNLPDSRPEAVAKAKRLIADPNFPSEQDLNHLAALLAALLTHRAGALPS